MAERPGVLGGRLVVDALRALGIKLVFGVPGGQTLSILDAMLDVDDIRFVATRHEGAAACMADAVGRLTDTPGVCLATTGPGATNLLTGIGGAFRDSSPVLAITCNNNLRDIDRDDAQAANHVAIFAPLTKRAMFVGTTEAIPQALAEAFLVAMSGCPGPVLVDFARDALESVASTTVSVAPPRTDPRRQRSPADPWLVREAASLIDRSRRPVIWLGNGSIRSGACASALRLAERLHAPVITTFNAIGAAPSAHPNVFGPRSRMGTALSGAVVRDADLLVAVGNSLNAISTNRWTLALPPQIVQIDSDPEKLGRYYPDRTVGLLGDAKTVLDQLASEITLGEPAVGMARQSRLESLQGERNRWRERLQTSCSPRGAVAPDRLVSILRAAAPDDTVLAVDAGNPGVWTHLWEVREAGEYLKPVGFGNMGFALPAAIAAALVGRPTVLALVGDGSMAMTMGELETLAREELAVGVVVMNDSSYGNIRQEQLFKFGDRTIGVDFGNVDFAGIARSCGISGVQVNTEADLRRELESGLESQRPFLVDVTIARDANVWTYAPFVANEPET